MAEKKVEFYIATNNGKGSAVQIDTNPKGDLFWEITNQTPGTTMQNKSFDWKTKQMFVLDVKELSDIVTWYNWVITQPNEHELKFPHLASKHPKTIIFKYNMYQGKPQIQLMVLPAQQQNQQQQQQGQQSSNMKMFNFKLDQFNSVVKVVNGVIANSLHKTGLYESMIIDRNGQIVKKSLFLPKLSPGDNIKFEKPNPQNRDLIITEMYKVIGAIYNYTKEMFEYYI